MEYNEQTAVLVEASRQGDTMRDFKASAFYDPLNSLVLDVLERRAFETFKKIDPSDTVGIMQAQMMSKVIDQIKQEMERIIQQGDLARDHLLNLDTEEDL